MNRKTANKVANKTDKADKVAVLTECLFGIGIALVVQAIVLTTLSFGDSQPIAVRGAGDVGKLLLGLFSLPLNFGITFFMAVWFGVWSLVITNMLLIALLIFFLKIVQVKRAIKLRYRVASYLTLIGVLAIYNLPHFVV